MDTLFMILCFSNQVFIGYTTVDLNIQNSDNVAAKKDVGKDVNGGLKYKTNFAVIPNVPLIMISSTIKNDTESIEIEYKMRLSFTEDEQEDDYSLTTDICDLSIMYVVSSDNDDLGIQIKYDKFNMNIGCIAYDKYKSKAYQLPYMKFLYDMAIENPDSLFAGQLDMILDESYDSIDKLQAKYCALYYYYVLCETAFKKKPFGNADINFLLDKTKKGFFFKMFLGLECNDEKPMPTKKDNVYTYDLDFFNKVMLCKRGKYNSIERFINLLMKNFGEDLNRNLFKPITIDGRELALVVPVSGVDLKYKGGSWLYKNFEKNADWLEKYDNILIFVTVAHQSTFYPLNEILTSLTKNTNNPNKIIGTNNKMDKKCDYTRDIITFKGKNIYTYRGFEVKSGRFNEESKLDKINEEHNTYDRKDNNNSITKEEREKLKQLKKQQTELEKKKEEVLKICDIDYTITIDFTQQTFVMSIEYIDIQHPTLVEYDLYERMSFILPPLDKLNVDDKSIYSDVLLEYFCNLEYHSYNENPSDDIIAYKKTPIKKIWDKIKKKCRTHNKYPALTTNKPYISYDAIGENDFYLFVAWCIMEDECKYISFSEFIKKISRQSNENLKRNAAMINNKVVKHTEFNDVCYTKCYTLNRGWVLAMNTVIIMSCCMTQIGNTNIILPSFEGDVRELTIPYTENGTRHFDQYLNIKSQLLTNDTDKQQNLINISSTSLTYTSIQTFNYLFVYQLIQGKDDIEEEDRLCYSGRGKSIEVFDFLEKSYRYDGSVIDTNDACVYKQIGKYNLQLYPNKLLSLLVSCLPPLLDPSQILNFSNVLLKRLTYQPIQTSLQTVDPSQILNLSTDLLRQLTNQPIQTSIQTVDPSQILNLSNDLLRQLAYQPTQTSLQTVDPSQILNFSNDLLRQFVYVEAKDNMLYSQMSDGYNRFMASMEEPDTFTVRTTRPGENGDKIESCYNPDGKGVDCPQ